MPNSRLNELFDLLNSNNLSAEQHTELLSLMADPVNEQQVSELLKEKWELFKPNKAPFTPEQSEYLLDRVHTKLEIEPQRNKFRIWPRIAAAASILFAIGAGVYVFHDKATSPKIAMDIQFVKPKQQGLVLTLADGNKITIDPLKQSNTYRSDGVQMDQQKGELVYGPESKADTRMLMHTLANNSGNKYKLILSDGTETYLDAQSSITYPVQFTGNQRVISITGQAYFKVKHDASKPFIVNAKDQTIEDIGTEFNVRAYDNVAITTLLEGSVRIHAKGIKKGLLLVPGQQGAVDGNNLSAKPADIEETIAWLQGKLVFNHEPLESILTQVAKVYDVKFTWQSDDLRAIKFTGAVSRTRPLNNIINFFRGTERVDFKSEGTSIKVIKHR